jgi:hypothetical protein
VSTAQVAFDFDTAVQDLLPKDVSHAITALAANGDVDSRGAVFTKVEVVEFILDLVGYTPDEPLFQKRLLEPSCGAGDFVLVVIDRLLSSCTNAGVCAVSSVASLKHAITAVELHGDSAEVTRLQVCQKLKTEGFDADDASFLAAAWIVEGDFLLTPLQSQYDYVVGNPPYVRQELIPPPLLRLYRQRYRTMYDRADIYVPFIERSLGLLSQEGELGFICSDRWMKNKYGGPLRRLVADEFHLAVFVDMVGTKAFDREVTAYPAITVIGRAKTGVTRIAYRPKVDRITLRALARVLTGKKADPKGRTRVTKNIAAGDEPWLLDQPELVPLVRRLEEEYPTLEAAGCKVGIGVATGADRAFIGEFDALDVEPDRKLRLATTRDIVNGRIEWGGLGVINPFKSTGGLVDLSRFPKLACYLADRRDVIANRRCARNNPARWYRTIDRIDSGLTARPKLLIPDIKGEATIAYEPGNLYPHHNLYCVTAREWDIESLQAVLLSGIAHLFVSIYSTRMRGGCLRFQAQYLRRIRIPEWKEVSPLLRRELREAGRARDHAKCHQLAVRLYNLSPEEADLLSQQMESN